MIEITQLPEIECPACKKTVRDESWWEWAWRDLREGFEIECPDCDAKLTAVEVDFPAPWAKWKQSNG